MVADSIGQRGMALELDVAFTNFPPRQKVDQSLGEEGLLMSATDDGEGGGSEATSDEADEGVDRDDEARDGDISS